MALELVLQRPSEKQDIFLRDHHRIVGYGGARGGGKSWAVQTKAKLLALQHPGIRIAIFRRTYPDLEKNHIRILVPAIVGARLGRYSKQEKRLTLINGSVIEFVFAQREPELRTKTQGIEWDVIFVDEATQWDETELKIIAACNRGGTVALKRMYYTCNPGGVGHQYIKRIFIDRKYNEYEDADDYSFIQAKVTDNTALMDADPEYVKHLQALPPKLRKAWLDGDWGALSGAFFEDFVDDPDHYYDRKHTHVIEPFEIPPGWHIMMGYDFGYRKPFSAAWYAVDYDGRLYRILEWYGCNGEPNEGVKMAPDEQFKHIHEIETQHPLLRNKRIRRIADPAIWNASSGESVADVADRHQVYFEPGDHERINGWMQCHYRLQFDSAGYPRFYAFNTCKDFIRTIPLMQYDEHKVEDLNSDLEDHIADEWRYVCMGRPIKPRIETVVVPTGDDPLNQRQHKRKDIFITHQT